MRKLLTSEFRHSLLGDEESEVTARSLDHHAIKTLLASQWALITRTLERVLGPTDLYETAIQELAHVLHQTPDLANHEAETNSSDFPLPGLVYRSPAMGEIARQLYKIRNSKLPALITGEPGTGKEGIARALHLLSDRKAGPFVAFNCTIVTKDLMSSQLFGHRKGSFTGADTNYQGSIRSAEGGTIFLDEIGDLPLDLQPKLLRFLQDGEVHPLGETKPVKVDVRVVTATNRDLEEMVAQGLFREDLYYRINILRFQPPPLRERREEIPSLAFHLLERFAQEANKPHLTFSTESLARLASEDWPGNIRQLSNQIQRAIALVGEDTVIQPRHLWSNTSSKARRASKQDWLDEILQNLPATPAAESMSEMPPPARPRTPSSQPRTLAEEVDGLEREIILETLAREKYNLSKTAQELGLTRRGLSLKMSRLQIDPKALKKATIQDAKPV